MKNIFLLLLCYFVLLDPTEGSISISISNVSKADKTEYCFPSSKTDCVDGVLLPAWRPIYPNLKWLKIVKATVYLVVMCYLFLGVSIISDRFMAAIEVITSKEKSVKVKKHDGTNELIKVRVWNETVSNLTLMALGSSAPEILLSIIEIIGKNFQSGELGPGTIVGSAAYNLFVIIGLCVLIIPDGEVKKIQHLSVFIITGLWSIFAYLWLYLILAKISVGVVEIWEAVLTLAFFPLTVFTAYIADTKLFFNKFLKRRFIRNNVKNFTKDTGDIEKNLTCNQNLFLEDENVYDRDSSGDFEKHRLEYLDIIKEIRLQQPNIDSRKLEELAQYEILKRSTKSRAFYRIQATRILTGSKFVIKKSNIESDFQKDFEKILSKPKQDITMEQKIFFDPGHYTVLENIGTMQVLLKRSGPLIENTFAEVEFYSEDGTATAHEDYVPVKGKIVFIPGQSEATINVTIIDDDLFEEDEHFYIQLKNLVVYRIVGEKLTSQEIFPSQLANPSMATIMILDDDHPGVFHFGFLSITVPETIGMLEIKVYRSTGARGHVRLPYKTVQNTAIGGGQDFEDVTGALDFYNDQTEATISVRIIDDTEYEKNKSFYIELGEPVLLEKFGRRKSSNPLNLIEDFGRRLSFSRKNSKSSQGNLLDVRRNSNNECKPKIKDSNTIQICIRESQELKHVVDQLMKKSHISQILGASSWKEQFKEALTVVSEEDENKSPSIGTYIMHYLSVFWKILFACVPPTELCGGWLCFWSSILIIGILTAIVGDVASSFGCNVGLTDSVTAITFVALGTSLPDTFASKVAALQDSTADSSVGNVMGSNAVNVYLGIGISWSIAACYHYANGSTFKVDSGSLGFSVTLFCIMAFIAIAIMLYRRKPSIGGELGGPKKSKIFTAFLFFAMWFIYILLSSLENYCHIPRF